jgi:hypothetical protein
MGLFNMASVIILVIIHFSVGINVVRQFSSYGDLFRSERNLAAFNIFIGVYGGVVGMFGLAAIYKNENKLGKTSYSTYSFMINIIAFKLESLAMQVSYLQYSRHCH